MDKLNMLPNEQTHEYIARILKMKYNKEIDETWEDVAAIITEVTGVYKAVSTWRRHARKISKAIAEVQQDDTEEQITTDDMKDLIFEYRKERYKIADERNQNNFYIRRLAREDTIKEIALEAAKEIGSTKMLPESRDCGIISKNEAILQLSDWHYGIEVNNFWNSFSPDICKRRVGELRDEVIHFCQLFDVKRLHVVNLSDLIAGRIHYTIRLESRCDAVTQIIKVSEILAEFLSEIASKGIHIDYYDCLDNHSRLEPIKADSLELESLVRIIPWYLKTRLALQDVTVKENVFSEDIITFKVLNGRYSIAGVHGHKDKPGKVVENLTLMTKHHYDMILTAHYHHPYLEERNEVTVISNGSLMGVDNYAKDLRLSSKASQNIILVTEDSVCDYVHIIKLN